MERSAWGEAILWRLKPRQLVPSGPPRVAFWALLALSACSTAMAVAVARTLHVRVGGLLLFGAWCVSLSIAVRWAPQWWHLGAEVLITDRRVIWKRGAFARSIERAGISFARINWHPSRRLGDLTLVRDVPTGALSRRLTITLRGIERPDLVWDFIRARVPAPPPPPPAEGVDGDSRPLGQRLDADERVVWSERPLTSWRRFLPRTSRDRAACLLGLAAFGTLARIVVAYVPAARKVLAGGVDPYSLGFLALLAAMASSSALLLGLGGALVWSAVVRPGLLLHSTRYWITDRRVVIAQGHEELQLDRSRIVDVIDAPASGADDGHDLFLILDGPRARAVSLQGAFGEGSNHSPRELRPVLRNVLDPDAVRRVLGGRAVTGTA
ncbi:MAG: hypothetical protein MUF34_19060 [Polyangiaceae bacterium]|jgi:hypothetical protein|nr:hypothetical protein [Polyangiaceae bacterium]